MIITPLSELDAINEILSSVGEAPINSMEERHSVDVMNAIRALQVANEEIQAKGWTFNTYDSLPLVPDVETKKIKYPLTYAVLKPQDGTHIRNRGGFVYNVTQGTDEFLTSIPCYAIEIVPFEELPSVFKRYIVARASVHFSKRYMGDESLLQGLLMEEQRAYAEVMETEIELEHSSLANQSDIQNLLQR